MAWTDDQINTLMFTLTSDQAGGAIHVRDALMRQAIDAVAAKVGQIADRVNGLATPPPVTLSDADRADIAAKLAALLHVPTAAEVVDEEAKRLSNG